MKNLNAIKIPPVRSLVAHFFTRYHVIAFTITVIGGLSVTSYYLNSVIASSADTSSTESRDVSPGFDKDTIERINNLNESSGDLKPLDFPSNQRTNPFTE